MRSSRGRQRGFTLVELSITIVIIGILAVIALVGYRKYVLHSKITEARGIIGAIKVAQEDYRAESGTYADLGTTWCPDHAEAGKGKRLVGWDPSCNGGNATWQKLAVHVNGPVLFQYRTTAGRGNYADDLGVSSWVGGTNNIRGPWYAVHARCDMDTAGGNVTELFSSSYDNQIFSRNEGE